MYSITDLEVVINPTSPVFAINHGLVNELELSAP